MVGKIHKAARLSRRFPCVRASRSLRGQTIGAWEERSDYLTPLALRVAAQSELASVTDLLRDVEMMFGAEIGTMTSHARKRKLPERSVLSRAMGDEV